MKRKRWLTVLVIAYILFIFSNSLKPADLSSADSGTVLAMVRSMCASVGLDGTVITEHFIRKMAHFSEYALLGILLTLCLKSYGFERERRITFQVITGFAVPFADETIQLFVEGRSGQISDVWLDCSGVLFGTILCTAAIVLLDKKEREKRG